MTRKSFGGTLVKYLLLLVFIGLLAGFFYWKGQYGRTGHIEHMPYSTKGYIVFLRQGPAGAANIYLVKADGTEKPRPLTSDTVSKLTPAWSPDGTKLCYSAEVKEGRSVTHQLFMLGGGDPRQATYGSVGKLSPQWRPDGRQIAFLSGGAVKVMNPNGEAVEQVYPHLHKEGAQEDESGANQNPQDAVDPYRQPPITALRWSPNGVMLATIQVNDDVAGMEVKGQANWWDKSSTPQPEEAPMVAEPETILLLPAPEFKAIPLPGAAANRIGMSWLPDGRQLAVAISATRGGHFLVIFHADEPLVQPTEIFRSMPFKVSQGGGPAQTQSVAPENPAVSPDGRRIAFEVWRMDSAENRTQLGIVVLPLDADHPLRVLSADDVARLPLVIKGRALNPQWSPDGERLLYSMPDSTGRRDLYVANADGSRPINLTKDVKADNFDASWSPAAR